MNNLKKLREEKDIKQVEVAKLLGITKASYSQMESNIENAKGPTLIRIAKLFNVSVDYLLGIIDEPLPLQREKNTPPPSDNSITLRQSDKDALERTAKLIQEILKK